MVSHREFVEIWPRKSWHGLIYVYSLTKGAWSWKFHQRKKCPQPKDWKIVGRWVLGVLYIYYNLFYHSERINLLNVEDDIDMFVLHFVFQSRINDHLNVFAEGWDCHKISSEKNLSPNHLWIMSLNQTWANSNTEKVMQTMTEVG